MISKMQAKYLVGALVISMTISSFAGEVKDTQSKDLVHLQRFGVSFAKPDDWFNQTPEEFKQTRERVNSLKESELLSLLASQGDIPVATFCKFDPRKHPGVIPTITVLVRPNPTKEFPEFFRVLKSSVQSLMSYFNNTAIVVEPEEVLISGKQSVMFAFEYDLNLADGKTHRVRSITYGIPFKDAFVQVGMTELSPAKNSDQFGGFIERLKINKQ